MKKILVAYFSFGGVTKRIAEYMQEAGASTLYRIEAAKPYSDGDLLAANPRARVCLEDQDAACRPEIASAAIDIAPYDMVVIGYPNWFLNAPKIIYTFLEKYNFGAKEVALFCTSGGSPVSQSANKIRGAFPDINFIGEKQFSYTSTRQDVAEWLRKLQ